MTICSMDLRYFSTWPSFIARQRRRRLMNTRSQYINARSLFFAQEPREPRQSVIQDADTGERRRLRDHQAQDGGRRGE